MGKALQFLLTVVIVVAVGQLARSCTQSVLEPRAGGLTDEEIFEIIPGWDILSLDERETLQAMIGSPQVRNPAEAAKLMQFHSAAGVVRLSDPELVVRAELLAKALEGVSTETCARVGGSAAEGAGVAEVQELLAQLDEEEVAAFHVLSLRAGVYEWRDDPPRIQLSDGQIDRALDVIEAELSDDEIEAFWSISMEPGNASSQDVCRVTRRLFGLAATVPEPENFLLARLLASS